MTYDPEQVQYSLLHDPSPWPTDLFTEGSSRNSLRREARVSASVSSPFATTSSSVPAAPSKTTTQKKPKNYLIRWKNGKPPKSKLKSKSNGKTRSSLSHQNNLQVVPFIKPASRPSLYPRISSPLVSNSCPRSPQLGSLRDGGRAIFFPNVGSEIGVSVKNCLGNKLVEEVADASESIASLLPPAWLTIIINDPNGHLIINWSNSSINPSLPQYKSPQVEYKFSFIRDGGILMSIGEFVGQIANIYDFWYRCDFDRFYKNKFSIRADKIRLRELILIDEKKSLWKVEAGY